MYNKCFSKEQEVLELRGSWNTQKTKANVGSESPVFLQGEVSHTSATPERLGLLQCREMRLNAC